MQRLSNLRPRRSLHPAAPAQSPYWDPCNGGLSTRSVRAVLGLPSLLHMVSTCIMGGARHLISPRRLERDATIVPLSLYELLALTVKYCGICLPPVRPCWAPAGLV